MPSLRNDWKNCGPTLYPITKRNNKKKTDLIGPGIAISICPTRTPTNNTDVTVPKVKLLYFNCPIQKPIPIVRNIAISGYVRKK